MTTTSLPVSGVPTAFGHRTPRLLRIRNLVYATVAVAMFGQPHGLFLYFPQFPILALVMVSSVVLLLLSEKSRRGSFVLPRANVLLPILAFVLLSAASLLYSADPAFGARILASMSFKILLFIAILDVCSELPHLLRLLQIIAVIGGAFALQGVLLLLAVVLFNMQPQGELSDPVTFGPIDYNFQLYSYGVLGFAKSYTYLTSMAIPRCQAMFTEPGWFANFLELSLFSTIGFAAARPSDARGWMRALIALQALALLVSFSTAGWLSVAIGLGVYVLVVGRNQRARSRALALIVVGALLATVFVLAFPHIANEVYKVIWTEKFTVEWRGRSSTEERMQSFEIALDLFRNRPLLGWGTSQMRVVTDSGVSANNAFMTVAAELGLVGVAVYLCVIASIVITIRRNVRLVHQRSDARIIALTGAIAGCVVALMTHSMFVDTNWTGYYWIGLALLYVNQRVLLRTRSEAAAAGQRVQDAPRR